MYSSIFCGTLESCSQDSDQKMEDAIGVKLYKIELLKFHDLASDLMILLSDSERDRANRYHFLKDKKRFIICRTLLKLLLAKHIGLHVDNIIFDVDSNKKPFLPSHPSVFFNVSHAGDYALIAIAKSAIGVDVEYINYDFDHSEISPNIFTKTETAQTENSTNKHLTFYKFWTRKEAIVKAIGKGIDGDFSKIQVTDGFHSIHSSIVSNFNLIKVFNFNLTTDYIGALAFTEDVVEFDKIIFYPIPTSDELKSFLSKR